MTRTLTPYRRKYLVLAVSKARHKLKERAVEYKGGKCSKCGYDKCLAAFDFHHLDPDQKDFRISGGHYRSFENIRAELDKTVLLCANCHREVHDEMYQMAAQERWEELRQDPPPRGRPS